MFKKEWWINYGEPEPPTRAEMIARWAAVGGLVLAAALWSPTPGEEVAYRHRLADEAKAEMLNSATSASQTGMPECGVLPPLVRKQINGPDARTGSYYMVLGDKCVTTVRSDDANQTPVGVIGPKTRIDRIGCVDSDDEMRVEYHRSDDFRRVVGDVAVNSQTFGGSAGPRHDCA